MTPKPPFPTGSESAADADLMKNGSAMNRRQFVKLSTAFPAATVTASLTLHKDGEPPINNLDLSVLRVQPDDIVVLHCDGPIDEAQAARLKALWEARFPHTRAVVLGDGLSVAGVLRSTE
jgi:hypothetical protein